jgi:DNA polymerase III epsilon subunit-like protein
MILATIDFEASGLNGNPIEVGIALWDREGPIKIWSSLISLVDDRIWDPAAEAIHHISKHDLANAPHPARVAEQLNRHMKGVDIAYCDGLQHDRCWLMSLFSDAGIEPVFELRDIGAMPKLGRFPDLWARMCLYLDQMLIIHRAGDDALNLMKAYAHAVGQQPNVIASRGEAGDIV